MAVGNVLGSNIFNVVILFTSDCMLRGASILALASPEHLLSIAMSMMLTCIVIGSIVFRSQKHFARLGIDVWLMLIVYIIGNAVFYLFAMVGN